MVPSSSAPSSVDHTHPGVLRSLRRNLGFRLLALGAGSALIASLSLVTIATRLSTSYASLARAEVDELIFEDLNHITTGVYNLVETESDAFADDLSRSLRVARGFLDRSGGIGFGAAEVEWTAVNQFSGETTGIALPRLLVGGQWQGSDPDPAVSSPFVDEVADLVGITVTIFQRMNERGDMLRVATTVRTGDGKRAVGTYIPAIMPDGSSNPVIETILDKGRFTGRAVVVDDWYLTSYEALRAPDDSIIGMLYVGQRQAIIESRIRSAIIDTSIGKTGYVYVIEGEGEDRGRYIVSQQGARDGENIWDIVDADGRYVIRDIVNAALALEPGELTTIRYLWLNPGETEPRWKIARLAYFAPWDWVIGASAYEDELEQYRAVLEKGRSRMSHVMIAAGLAIVVAVGALAILLARSIAMPLRALAGSARAYSRDGAWVPVHTDSFDDVSALSSAYDAMAGRIQETLLGLRRSEEKFRSIYENALEGIYRTNIEGAMLDANPAMVRMLGYSDAESLRAAINDIGSQIYTNKEDRESLLADIRAHGISLNREFQFRKFDGSIFWVSINAWALRHDDGSLCGIEGFITDIDRRKQSEASLLSTLKQKDALLREVHHRVKNNLQILVSLLGLEADRPASSEHMAVLHEFAARVHAMAQIHELVYHSADLSRVDMLEYTRLTADNLYHNCKTCFGTVDYTIEGEALPLGLDQAIPCGLLISEILSNSFRHAFRGNGLEKGSIRVRFGITPEGKAVLSLSDNGLGLPPEVGPSSGGRLGMTLIPVLADQIGAELILDRTAGTSYTVCFAVAAIPE